MTRTQHTRKSFGLTVTAAGRDTTDMHIERSGAPDLLTAKADKLYALLNNVTGEQSAGFRGLAVEFQENILWLASDLAHEITLLSRVVVEMGERA
jgi:hypothetical protein